MKFYNHTSLSSFLFIAVNRVLFWFLFFYVYTSYSQTKKIDSLISEGSVYEEKHNYNQAHANYQEALRNSQLIMDKTRLQKCYMSLGTLFYRKGDYSMALDFSTKSIRLAEEINDKHAIAFGYSMLGTIYNDNGDTTSGVNYLKKAITLAERLNDKKLLANFYNKLGAVYFQSNNFENAIGSYKTALKILEEINYKKGISGNLGSLGTIYLKIGKYELASEFANKQLKMAEESKNKAEIANALYTKGGILVELGKDKDALEYFKKSLQLAREIGSTQAIRYAYDGIVTANYNMGNFKDAFDNYESFKLISDSIFNLERSYQINEIKIKYEVEKKEFENKMLSQQTHIQSLELKQNNNIIFGLLSLVILVTLIGFLLIRQSRSQSEKKALQLEQSVLRAQMNPHFIFNSLNSIQRLFIEGKTDKANDAMADFSSLLRRILNNSDQTRISLKEELDTLKLYMDLEKIRCDHCFDYIFNMDEAINTIEIQVPPLVLQPIVENAIWHGILPTKVKGLIKITILLSANKKQLLCTIEDNGIGIPDHKLMGPNSKGIKITQERLGSKIELKRSNTGGTIVNLNIQLN